MSRHILRLPHNPEDKLLSDVLFEGIVMTGAVGVGKTNGVKVIAQSATTYNKTPLNKRVCAVVIDSENQFNQFTKMEDLPQRERELCKQMGMSDPEVVIFRLSDKRKVADATMSMSEMTFEDYPFLCSSLEGKSEDRFRRTLKQAYGDLQENNQKITHASVRERALDIMHQTSSNLFAGQIKAIARALDSIELETLFDQPNLEHLTAEGMIQPGRIVIINIEDLSDIGRKVAVAYLMQLLHNYKERLFIEKKELYPSILLILDEIDKILNKDSPSSQRIFEVRIESRLKFIVERGRKRNFGIMIVTHSPRALAPIILKLPKIKITFQLGQHAQYLTEAFGKQFITEIESLEIDTARIRVNIIKGKQGQIDAKLRFPRIHFPSGVD